MQNSRTGYVVKNTVSGIAVKTLNLLMNFVIKTAFIKVLGIQYTGVSSLFADILTVLSFAELGIGTAVTYALYRPVAEGDERQIAGLMNFYRSAYQKIALFVFAVGVALLPFLDFLVTDVPDIKEDIRLIYLLYLTNAAVSYLLIYKSSILVAKQKKYIASGCEGIFALVRMAAGAGVIIFSKAFIVYLLQDIALIVLQNLIISRMASKEYHANSQERLSGAEKKSIMADVRALAMYQMSGVVISGTDSIVISAMLGTSLVGFLSYYKMIANGIIGFLQQFFSAANASVGNLAVQGDGQRQYQLFKGIDFAVFWINAVCVCALYMVLNPFVEIWLGEQYLLPKTVVVLLVADFFASNMIRVVAMFRTSNGLFVQGKYRPVIMSVLNIVLSVLLAKPFGVEGVLAATVASRLLTQVWYDPMLIYRKVFEKNVRSYYLSYAGYIATIAGSIFVLEAGASYVSSNFLFLLFGSAAVPSSLIFLLWRRTEGYNECMVRIKRMINGGK